MWRVAYLNDLRFAQRYTLSECIVGPRVSKGLAECPGLGLKYEEPGRNSDAEGSQLVDTDTEGRKLG